MSTECAPADSTWPEDAAWRDELIVATRIHNKSASHMADPRDVEAFVHSALEYATRVIVCIGYHDADATKNLSGLQAYVQSLAAHLEGALGARMGQVQLLPVCPWGAFTGALNAATGAAADVGYAYIAFQSLEFRLPRAAALRLLTLLRADPDVLVAGPQLAGHHFQPGIQVLRGRTCPWNTFAIWSVRHLAQLGFPMAGDALGSRWGGVEEVSAVALAQHVRPALKALLVRAPSARWDTDFADAQRLAWHESKMGSKDARPAAQMRWLAAGGGAAAGRGAPRAGRAGRGRSVEV